MPWTLVRLKRELANPLSDLGNFKLTRRLKKTLYLLLILLKLLFLCSLHQFAIETSVTGTKVVMEELTNKLSTILGEE